MCSYVDQVGRSFGGSPYRYGIAQGIYTVVAAHTWAYLRQTGCDHESVNHSSENEEGLLAKPEAHNPFHFKCSPHRLCNQKLTLNL